MGPFKVKALILRRLSLAQLTRTLRGFTAKAHSKAVDKISLRKKEAAVSKEIPRSRGEGEGGSSTNCSNNTLYRTNEFRWIYL